MTDLTLLTSLSGAVWRHTAMLRLELVEWLTGSGYFLQVKTEIDFTWSKSLSILRWIKYYNLFCEAKNWDIKWPHNALWLFLSPSHPWTNNFFIFCGLDCFQNKESHVLAIWVSEFWNCSLSISCKCVTLLNIFLAEIGKG